MAWQLADAKNKLSEVVTLALTKEPQRIARRGQTVVVIAEDELLKLQGKKRSFVQHILNIPQVDDFPQLPRDTSPMREVRW